MQPRRRSPSTALRELKPDPMAREKLLDALDDLLKASPRDDPTISDVADRAGLNRALVGYYFAGKEGMITALTQRILRTRLKDLRWLVSQPYSPTQKLRLLITGTIISAERYPYLERLMNRVCERETEAEVRVTADLVRPIVDCYVEIFEEGISQGFFRSFEPRLLYYNIIGACYRIFSLGDIWDKMFREGGSIDQDRSTFMKQTSSLLVAGILLPGVSE